MTVNPTQLASEVTRTALAAHAYTLAGGICACGLDLEETHGNYQAARRAHAAEVAARALAEAGLLAPAPLTEEWAARYVNGGGAVCRTRREAEAELGRMIHSQRPRIDEPPAPPVAGIYVRHVTAWEPVDGIDRSEGGKAATSD